MPRLRDVINEFRQSYQILAKYLREGGFKKQINPSSELTPEMYAFLESRYAKNLGVRKAKKCLEENSRYLDIGKCNLTDVDFESGGELDSLLSQCIQLNTLVLSNSWWDLDERKWVSSANIQNDNHLTKIPKSLASCTSLKKIVCNGDSNNRWEISDISLVNSLNELVYLDLSYNNISGSIKLENLSRLNALFMSGNKIEEIKAKGNLTTLKILDLNENEITQIRWLQNLTSINILQLGNNKISVIEGLNKMTQLVELGLSGNQLSELQGIEKLAKVRSLNLSHNQIASISGLQKLSEITEVNLSYNKIESIAEFDYLLGTIKEYNIILNDNPFILKYNLQLTPFENHYFNVKEAVIREKAENKSSFIYPIKIIVLGNHNSGKSSLVNFIVSGNHESIGSTHILRIVKHNLGKGDNPYSMPDVVFYDFGGQDFYHGLYQAFISVGSIQLIVFNNKNNEKNIIVNENNDASFIDYNRNYWLGQKKYLEKNISEPSPYFVVQTHSDIENAVEALPLNWSEYPGYQKSFFLSYPPYSAGEEILSNSVSKKGREYFQAFLEQEVRALQMLYPREEPQWYIDFMGYILQETHGYEPLSINDVSKYYNPPGIADNEKKELLKARLGQLHKNGLVLYYNSKSLDNIVWLNPQALVEHIQKDILTRKKISGVRPGVIAKSEFENLMDDKTVELLKLQKIIFLHRPSKEYSNLDEYIIPNYLPLVSQTDIDYQLFTFGLGNADFTIKFNDFIPFGFINQMVCFYGKQPDAKKFWRNQLVFTLEGKIRVLILLDFEQLKIKVHVHMIASAQQEREKVLGYLFFTILALYWNFETDYIPIYNEYNQNELNFIPVTGYLHNGDDKPLTYVQEIVELPKNPPDDAYLSLDDKRFVKYADLVNWPSDEYRIKSYGIGQDCRINIEDVKEIPVSNFAPFTASKLSLMKNLFISYSHNDIQFRQELQGYLINLERDGLINRWDDGLLQAGDNWDEKIKNGLEKADICIMLLSQAFIASNYVHEVEFKKIMEKRKNEDCRIIPILIKDCDWKNWTAYPKDVLEKMTPKEKNDYKVASFQFMPQDREQRLKALYKWQYPEEAWMQVVDAIRKFCSK